MKKKALIDDLKEALRSEESVIKIYAQHIRALSKRCSLSKPFLDNFKTITKLLIGYCDIHKNKCKELINYVKKEKKDDI